MVVEDEEGRRSTVGPPALTGDAVEDASAVIDPSTGAWHVQVEFRSSGAERWARFTGEVACSQPGDPQRSIAIVLDQTVISTAQVAPEIACNEGITGGATVITGNFDEGEAKELALLIRAGALPVPVNIVEQRTVGPTLGEAAIKASIQAAVIGATLTIGYMILFYRLLGAVAAVALLAYGLLSFGLLLALDATLTLPGIAGFVLAIGMAVDANVLVFERIKEEYAAKGKVVTAVGEGFKKAWSAIADSNATTLLAAFLLFFLGSGAVRGFGVTLSIGVAVSMFTALVVTRVLIEMIVRLSPIHNHPRLLGVGARRRLREWLEQNPINLIGHRRVWFTLSSVVVIGALAGPFVRGMNYGIEFTGGRLLEYSTTASPDINELRAELAERGLARVVVQESGEGNIAIRTGALDSEGERTVQSAVEEVGGRTEELRDELVGPSIGDELRRKALIALALALLAQLGYLAMRFRWNLVWRPSLPCSTMS